MFGRKKKNKFDQPPDEPLFMAVPSLDGELDLAHSRASASMPEFNRHVQRPGGHLCSAKLRFRDPSESERTGTDVFLFLWLTAIERNPTTGAYTGTFFEVPPELAEWHWAGQRLAFDGADVFDWMVNEDGRLHGGFTLRVSRTRLPERDREAFDRHIGVTEWEPLSS